MDIKQYLSDPTFLTFTGILLGGLFFPQVRAFLSKLKLPSKPDTPSTILGEFKPLAYSENMARHFALSGDEENTMLAIAMMKGVVDSRGVVLTKLCADCKADKKKENHHDE